MFDVQQTTQDLEATITYLREHDWVQGRNFDRWGACCAWGAVLMATDDIGKHLSDQHRSADVGRVFYRTHGKDLMVYNDDPGRTKAEVVTKLEQGLAALKADPSLLTAKKKDHFDATI